MKKNLVFGICIAFLFVNIFGVVSADLYSYSEKGVQYEKKILNELENSKWIDVIIKVKDFSNITISGKDSIEIQKVKDQQRNKIFNDVTNSILLTLSEEDFRYKDRTISGRTFFGYVTEEGFNKLLNNSNIRAIYLEEYITLLGKDKIGLAYEEGYRFKLSQVILSIVALIIMALIIYFIIKRLKKENGKNIK